MMMNKGCNFTIVFFLFTIGFYAQNEHVKDSTKIVDLEEVIVIGRAGLNNQDQAKPLSSIDEYLEQSSRVTMIKRGNYAWEPAINNMVTDRISVTIDGMQIFGACTDKMDPITSYVDVSNLSEVHVKSGQQGAENGATIGGGIDLKLQKNNFDSNDLDFGVDTGFETNGNATILSSEFNYSNESFFINSDIIHRKSDNYFAGGSQEVLFSQFEKYNVSTVLGFKTSEKGAVIGSVIYDKATDVGYPALPMDVSLAKALITSVSYEHKNWSKSIKEWESKLYYNSITHVMDDTKRPNVPVHMDMPGWSETYGFYSKMHVKKNNHHLLFNLNGFYNKSLAEMTMYPNNPDENLMFMLTWPDVRRFYSGIYGEDNWMLKNKSKVKFSARIGYQHDRITSAFGWNSLRIFYPELEDTNNRAMANLAAQYEFRVKQVNFLFGAGYGSRSPSVTEAYGFYLYNSFDNFDYIGNPYLENEKSTEFHVNINYNVKRFKIGAEASFFYIKDYIIGEIDRSIDHMTIGADGVKVYTALDHATIFNTSLVTSYNLHKTLVWKGSIGYSLGQDNQGDNLPLISPFTYGSSLHYHKKRFTSEINLNGAGAHKNYNSDYGESQSDAYIVFNANAAYNFYFGSQKLFVKSGIENILDTYYSTYADWKNIPRMGRNIFVNVSFVFK